jgi:hypothetical protein
MQREKTEPCKREEVKTLEEEEELTIVPILIVTSILGYQQQLL